MLDTQIERILSLPDDDPSRYRQSHREYLSDHELSQLPSCPECDKIPDNFFDGLCDDHSPHLPGDDYDTGIDW